MNFDVSMKRTLTPIMKNLHATLVFATCTTLVSAMPGAAEGQTSAASDAIVATTETAGFLQSADIDGDGMLDLVSGVNGNNSVQIFLNSTVAATGASSDPGTSSTVNLSTPYSNMYFADLNRDRLPELISSENSSASMLVQFNKSTSGKAAFAEGNPFNLKLPAQLFFACDMNMDGYQDIIAATGNQLEILKNNTTAKGGAIALSSIQVLKSDDYINSIKCADMDGDGNIDIIAATATGVIVYSGKGNGFEFTVSYTGSKYVAVGGMDIGDLDGDYLPEIVLSHWPENSFSILRNISYSGNTGFNIENPITCAGVSDIALCDYNQDGLFDIMTLANGMGWNIAQIFKNKTTAQGRYVFSAPQAVAVSGSHFEISDFDNNGSDDIAAVNPRNNKIAIAYNTNVTTKYFQQTDVFCGEDGYTTLEWKMNTEPANAEYVIERTDNGTDFVRVTSIQSNTNNPNKQYNYTVNENIPTATGYRIKLVSSNTVTEYSELYLIEPCDNAVTDFVCVFPNPVEKLMNFQFSVKAAMDLHFEIMDDKMQPVMEKSETITPGTRTYTLDIDQLAKGSYLLAVRFGNLAPKVCRFEKL